MSKAPARLNMLKIPLVLLGLLGSAVLCISGNATPSYAQLRAERASDYYGVVINSTLNRESFLATFIRNIGIKKEYGSNEFVTIWSSAGWVPYPGREDTPPANNFEQTLTDNVCAFN